MGGDASKVVGLGGGADEIPRSMSEVKESANGNLAASQLSAGAFSRASQPGEHGSETVRSERHSIALLYASASSLNNLANLINHSNKRWTPPP